MDFSSKGKKKKRRKIFRLQTVELMLGLGTLAMAVGSHLEEQELALCVGDDGAVAGLVGDGARPRLGSCWPGSCLLEGLRLLWAVGRRRGGLCRWHSASVSLP